MRYLILLLFIIIYLPLHAQEDVVSVLGPEVFVLEKSYKDSKVTVPITLPPRTIKWYYSVSIVESQQMVEDRKKSMDLFGQLFKMWSNPISSVLSNVVKFVSTPDGEAKCNVSLIGDGQDNFNPTAISNEASRTNFISGTIEIKNPINCAGKRFLKFENPDFQRNIKVVLEVVAITLNDKAIQKPISTWNLSGRWRDENSIITLESNSKFDVAMNDGKKLKGTWSVSDNIIYFDHKTWASRYRILRFDGNSFTFQNIDGGNEVFNAERM